jgi:hypothetical protein
VTLLLVCGPDRERPTDRPQNNNQQQQKQMLKLAGVPVAMGNAPAHIQSLAKCVITVLRLSFYTYMGVCIH